jgi:hypothetical protein
LALQLATVPLVPLLAVRTMVWHAHVRVVHNVLALVRDVRVRTLLRTGLGLDTTALA